jgi:hypothetical protein
MEASMMKLIFKSKILEDDTKTLDHYAVVEGAAIVVMVQKVSSFFCKPSFNQAKPTKAPGEEAKQEEQIKPTVTLTAPTSTAATTQAASTSVAQSQPIQQPVTHTQPV